MQQSYFFVQHASLIRCYCRHKYYFSTRMTSTLFCPTTIIMSPATKITDPPTTTTGTFRQQNQLVDPTFVLKLSTAAVPRHASESSTTTKETLSSSDSSSVTSDDDDDDIDVLSTTNSLQLALGVESSQYINRRPWIVGHRGCLYDELENTREGFQKCAEMGADAVELDVFLLKCGTLIVFHGSGGDENPGCLLEYCGVNKSILDLTYKEALELTFNSDYVGLPCPADKMGGAGRIPTLEQVLMDAKKSGLHIKIELKGPNTVEPTLEVVERLQMESQCSYASFNKERISHLRKLRPDRSKYPTGALFANLPNNFLEQAEKAGATEIQLRYDTCHVDTIAAIHNAGFRSMAWFRGPIAMANDCKEKYWDLGVENEIMYEALLRTGVQQMCVNKPDILVRYRQKHLIQEHLTQ